MGLCSSSNNNAPASTVLYRGNPINSEAVKNKLTRDITLPEQHHGAIRVGNIGAIVGICLRALVVYDKSTDTISTIFAVGNGYICVRCKLNNSVHCSTASLQSMLFEHAHNKVMFVVFGANYVGHLAQVTIYDNNGINIVDHV